MTVEATNLKPKLIGFTYFPLFIDKFTGMPYKEEQDRALYQDGQDKSNPSTCEIVLHKGNYHMPIHYGYYFSASSISDKDFSVFEKIPNAFILMRFDHASIDALGNIISINDTDPHKSKMAYVPPPKYES